MIEKTKIGKKAIESSSKCGQRLAPGLVGTDEKQIVRNIEAIRKRKKCLLIYWGGGFHF